MTLFYVPVFGVFYITPPYSTLYCTSLLKSSFPYQIPICSFSIYCSPESLIRQLWYRIQLQRTIAGDRFPPLPDQHDPDYFFPVLQSYMTLQYKTAELHIFQTKKKYYSETVIINYIPLMYTSTFTNI